MNVPSCGGKKNEICRWECGAKPPVSQEEERFLKKEEHTTRIIQEARSASRTLYEIAEYYQEIVIISKVELLRCVQYMIDYRSNPTMVICDTTVRKR